MAVIYCFPSKYRLICVSILFTYPIKADSAGSITSVPDSINGSLTACPGDLISLTCTHSNFAGELTRWRVSGAVNCDVIVSHITQSEQFCGPFTITMISDNNGPNVSSTAQTSDTAAVDGVTVECFAGALSMSPLAGSSNISILGKDCANN